MKVAVYLETSTLEQIALEGKLTYVSQYGFHLVFDGNTPPEGKWFAGEFELKLPSRDQAVMWAEKALKKEAALSEAYYKERLSKLLALTWEGGE